MKEFLFIVPLTPAKFQTSIRKDLYQLFLRSLDNQKSDRWMALMIGEEEKREGNYIYLDSGAAITKREKLLWVCKWLAGQTVKPRYLIRMDDDDIISKYALERLSGLDFDCYRDLYHYNYDISTALVRISRLRWFPNTTVIACKHHAVPSPENKDLPLLMSDHCSWHEYLASKKVLESPKYHPMYMRIMSPASKSVHETNNIEITEPQTEDIEAYNRYKGGGNWKRRHLGDFEEYVPELLDIWNRYSKSRISRKLSFLDRINPFPL